MSDVAKAKHFRIYYGDGSIYEGIPEKAPTGNVQAIAYNDPKQGAEDTGRIVLTDWDFYIYSDPVAGWHGANKYADLMRHLKLGCGPGGVRAVLEGQWVDFDNYKSIVERARTDPNLDRKTANDPVREDGRE